VNWLKITSIKYLDMWSKLVKQPKQRKTTCGTVINTSKR